MRNGYSKMIFAVVEMSLRDQLHLILSLKTERGFKTQFGLREVKC